MAIQLTEQHLDVGLVTFNETLAIEFYANFLGLTQDVDITIPSIGVIKRFKVGKSTLRIIVAENEPAHKGSSEGFMSQTGIRYLTLSIANLDETMAAAKAARYKVPLDIMVLRPGTRVAQVQDPDGNTVELMQVESSNVSARVS